MSDRPVFKFKVGDIVEIVTNNRPIDFDGIPGPWNNGRKYVIINLEEDKYYISSADRIPITYHYNCFSIDSDVESMCKLIDKSKPKFNRKSFNKLLEDL